MEGLIYRWYWEKHWGIMRSEKQSVARVKDCRQIKTDALKVCERGPTATDELGMAGLPNVDVVSSATHGPIMFSRPMRALTAPPLPVGRTCDLLRPLASFLGPTCV